MNIKIIHWGEDYVLVQIGSIQYSVSVCVGRALDRQIKKFNKKNALK